jgi:DNA-binding response OmpR family regulator
MSKGRLLIVEDDFDISNMLRIYFDSQGYETIIATRGEEALEVCQRRLPNLVVLDIVLPDIDGYEVCRNLRGNLRTSHIPIIFLTQKDERSDQIAGLELGADDYITKPFSPRQLVARAQAVLRRAGQAPSTAIRELKDITLFIHHRKVRIGQHPPIQLTRLECCLLDYLMLNAGHVLTTDALIEHLWGSQIGDRDMLRQIVHRLRGKIEPEASSPTLIETIPGIGYGIALPDNLD